MKALKSSAASAPSRMEIPPSVLRSLTSSGSPLSTPGSTVFGSSIGVPALTLGRVEVSIAARRPIRHMSLKRQQWEHWVRLNYGIADRRANGICEGCGKNGSRLDHHHIVGRSEGEPIASMAELLAVLCSQCHRAVTGTIGGGIN